MLYINIKVIDVPSDNKYITSSVARELKMPENDGTVDYNQVVESMVDSLIQAKKPL